MDNQMILRDKIKVQIMLVILYVASDIAVYFFLLDIDATISWREELKKILCLVGVIFIVTLLFISIKKFSSRKCFAYFGGGECIIFSLIILCMILERYYKLYEKLSLEIICIYAGIAIILFLCCRVPSENQLNKKEKKEFPRGLSYAITASVIGIGRILTTDQIYARNIIVSMIPCCGWLALGWFMLKGAKVYIRDADSETDE